MKKCLFMLFVMFCSVCFANLPVSKEASILEVISSSEISIQAVGVYNSTEKRKRKRKKDVRKTGKEKAMQDAKKAAVYYLLYNGTDPFLSDSEEMSRFSAIQETFFSQDIIDELIVYSDAEPYKVVSLNEGQGVKVFAKFIVNAQYLRQLLEENLVIFSRQELSAELGYPQIIVLPVVSKTESPLEVLSTDKQAQHAAAVIESYLTAREYDVIVPSQLDDINQLVNSIQVVENVKTDSAYALALSIGSDVYIDYSVGESISAYDTEQISVTLRVYETTTGRLLGTETGYSKPRVGEGFLSIEEALLSALSNVTQRLLNYWETDLAKGIQYKVITSVVATDLSEEKLEDVQDDMFDGFDTVARIVKENVVTDKTFDVTLWCDYEQYPTARALYKMLRAEFSDRQNSLRLSVVNRNRKLLLLEIK